MSRLRAKEQVVTTSQIEGDIYHCCRWCKWCIHIDYDGWRCTNPCYGGSVVDTSFVVDMVEDGGLSDTIEEALHDVPSSRERFMQGVLSVLREWKIGKRHIEEMEEAFNTCLDMFLDTGLKVEIDSSVSSLLYNRAGMFRNKMSDLESGIIIKDPFTHYCREFQ